MTRVRLVAVSLLLFACPAWADEPTPVGLVVAVARCPDSAPFVAALLQRGISPVTGDAPFSLELRGSGDDVHAVLVDRSGETLLDRTLPSGECTAVADTVALLVERRLEGVSWEAPPVEPPPRPARTKTAPPSRPTPTRAVERPRISFDLLAGIFFETGFEEDDPGPGPEIGGRLHLARAATVGASLGWLRHDAIEVGAGSLRIDRVPLSLFGAWSRRRSGLELDLEARIQLEILAARTRGIADPGRTTEVSLRAGPGASLAVELEAPVWIVVHAGLLALLAGPDLVVHTIGERGERTPVATQGPAIELGAAAAWRFGGGERSTRRRP